MRGNLAGAVLGSPCRPPEELLARPSSLVVHFGLQPTRERQVNVLLRSRKLAAATRAHEVAAPARQVGGGSVRCEGGLSGVWKGVVRCGGVVRCDGELSGVWGELYDARESYAMRGMQTVGGDDGGAAHVSAGQAARQRGW
eukprot:366072-Chlamydomonas_euryale.AAC.15